MLLLLHLKRQSEHSGLRPDTSSPISFCTHLQMTERGGKCTYILIIIMSNLINYDFEAQPILCTALWMDQEPNIKAKDQ